MTNSVSMSRPSPSNFQWMQANSSAISAIKQRVIVFWREASSLKPTMDRDHVQFRISNESILINRSARGPAGQNVNDGMICCHDRHFMTNSVIRQRCRLGD